MSIQVTIGDNSGQAETPDDRGTVTVALAKPSGNTDEESMLEFSTTLQNNTCAARLTIAEAEILQHALDNIVLEAAVPGLGREFSARDKY